MPAEIPGRSKKSILFLGTQMAVGGAQRVLLDQARWFHDAGYTVTAAFFYDKENLREQWQTQNLFPIINLGARQADGNHFINAARLLGALIRLWKLLRNERIDVIETFTPHSNVLGIPVAWLAGCPVRIATHHTKIEGAARSLDRFHGWVVNSGLASHMVAVSDQVRMLAICDEGVRPEHIQVILNGITLPKPQNTPTVTRAQLERKFSIDAQSPLILTVGRLTVQKGQTYLLAAAPKVLARFPNIYFAIAGAGHQRSNLIAQAADLGIQDAVKFLGKRADIPDLLAAADLFVLPSLWEGLPLALLEAMGAGKPVVATRVEGVEDVLDDGRNGYLVPPANADALARALIQILSEGEDVWRLFGERGKRLIVKEYTIDRACQQYEQLFLEKLG